jgi:mono/diheme cytochrome c family protein
VPCDPSVVYFTTEVLPILRSNCAKSGCHDAITHEEGIILDSYQNVMNSDDVVEPFDLDDSEMFEKITEDDSDDRMPPPPNQRLTADQINTIATWILQGAKDLTCDDNTGGCNTNNITYSGFVAPLLTTNCVGCHSGGAPSGGITLNTHAGVQSVALNGRLYGAISHASGFQPMPRGSAKLSQCTIDKVKAWIDNGAQNN